MTQTLVKLVADFSTTLVSKVAVGDTTATLTSGLDEDGVQLPTGTYGFTIDRNNSQKEHFTATLTGTALTNIKHVTRGTGTASTGFNNTHRKGAEVVITDHVALKRISDVLDGTTNLDSGTILAYDGTVTPTLPNQLVTKSLLDATALGSVTITTVLVPGNAGETVSAGNLLYLDVADGEWKKCDADTAATVDNIILGIAQGSGTDGVAISGGLILQGLDTHQSGLTTNTAYYASNTAGAITSTPGTTEVSIGVSRSTTSILFFPRYNQQLTENQQDALAGTAGTPSSTNLFVTNDDTTGTGLIVRSSITNNIARFGGDGSDGALTVSSGTTNIDLGGLEVVTKNYTSISITGTGAVTFSNPHNNGTIIKLLSQGDVTLTSSAAPMLDARGCGAIVTGTPTNSIDNVTQGGTAGTAGVASPGSGAGATGSTSGTGGAAATSGALVWYTTNSNKLERRQIILTCGTAGRNGAAGGAGTSGGAVGSAGTGGTGGAVLYIECKGAWNFTTASGISVAGNNGTAGGNASVGAGSSAGSGGGSGGSGGSAGMCLVLYNTLTANSGTITVSGGNGGNGGNGANAVGAQGGSGANTGGASGASAGGGAGGLNGAGGGAGGAGGAGGTPASSGNAGTAASAGTGGGGGGGAGGASGGSGGAGGNGGSGTAGSGTGGGTAGTGGSGGSNAGSVGGQYGFGGGGGGGGGHGGAGGTSLVAKNLWFA